jgi:hypothetical protein
VIVDLITQNDSSKSNDPCIEIRRKNRIHVSIIRTMMFPSSTQKNRYHTTDRPTLVPTKTTKSLKTRGIEDRKVEKKN